MHWTYSVCLAVLSLFGLSGAPWAATPQEKKPVQHIVFEAANIEGALGSVKTLVVTTEKRPEFSPMALELAHKTLDLRRVSRKVLDEGLPAGSFEEKFP